MVVCTCNLSAWGCRQEDQEFKVILAIQGVCGQPGLMRPGLKLPIPRIHPVLLVSTL